MWTFRSKTKYRRFSNDFSINEHVMTNFHPENLNFHIVSFVSMALITNFSSRYGKWIKLIYGLIFTTAMILFYFKKHKNYLHQELIMVKSKIVQQSRNWRRNFQLIYEKIDKIERHFFKLKNIGSTLSQLVFFTTCEITLLPEERVTALYSLMLYNAIGYCISYIKQLTEATTWSPFVNVANHSKIHHLAMSATKTVLEITKATFASSIVFMLFVVCVEQRQPYYFRPNRIFTFCTAVYFLLTEKMFVDVFTPLLARTRISRFDNLEILRAPVILSSVAQILSFAFALLAFVHGAYRAALITLYLNVYLDYKKLVNGDLKTLANGTALVSVFRFATKNELDRYEDVCAVCLSEMQLARVTPCHHMFHTDCLRRCLISCDRCPVCKGELKFS